MSDTTGITGKKKKDLRGPSPLHYFGRLVMKITGLLFILLAAITLVFSCYELIMFLIDGGINPIAMFVHIAEYYLITVTFTLVGQAVLNLGRYPDPKTEDLGTLKESLLAMVVSISGVVFIEMILENKSPAELGIDILYVGVAIASVAVGLGIFIRLGMHKKVEEEREKE